MYKGIFYQPTSMKKVQLSVKTTYLSTWWERRVAGQEGKEGRRGDEGKGMGGVSYCGLLLLLQLLLPLFLLLLPRHAASHYYGNRLLTYSVCQHSLTC